MKTKLIYEFTEGIGGGSKPSYLLLLNGGICKGYPKERFTKESALELVNDELNYAKQAFGERQVTFENKITNP